MGRASIAVALLALSASACGGKTDGAGTTADASEDEGPVDCVAAGGQCLTGDLSFCNGVAAPMMGCPGLGTPGAEYCCLPVISGFPGNSGLLAADASDSGQTGDDGGSECTAAGGGCQYWEFPCSNGPASTLSCGNGYQSCCLPVESDDAGPLDCTKAGGECFVDGMSCPGQMALQFTCPDSYREYCCMVGGH